MLPQSQVLQSHDISHLIFEYLCNPRCLAHCSQVSKTWSLSLTRDSVWLHIASKRYGVLQRQKKAAVSQILHRAVSPLDSGGATWKRVYCNRVIRQALPHLLTCRSSSLVFARGRRWGVDLFCLLLHRSGCRVTELQESTGRSRQVVEVRCVIQNIHNEVIRCGAGGVSMRRKSCSSDAQVATFELLPTSKPAFTAYPTNGRITDGDNVTVLGANQDAVLRPFQCAVFTFLVVTPGSVFETDFLASGLSVELQFTKGRNVCGEAPVSCTLSAPFMDELKVWDHYEQVSGGFMCRIERTVNGL